MEDQDEFQYGQNLSSSLQDEIHINSYLFDIFNIHSDRHSLIEIRKKLVAVTVVRH